MTIQFTRNATLAAAVILTLGAATATGVFASSDRWEHGRGDGYSERGEHESRRDRDHDRRRVHREDRDFDRGPAASGTTLSIDALAAKLKEQGFDSIVKVQRKSGAFEVKARNANGALVELWADGATGQVLRSKLDD